MSSIVLDTGALMALERSDKAMWAQWTRAMEDKVPVVVPSAALALVWRGSSRQARLASALGMCEIDSFDARVRDIGVLCGRAGTADICDAHVALVACEVAEFLFTSDPDDLSRLIAAIGTRRVAIVRC